MNTLLHVDYRNKFPDMLYKEHLSILREKVKYHMLQCKENDFIDLDTFNREYVKNMAKTQEMVSTICKELKELGWNTYLGFGDTGLYIYSTPEKPDGVY
jgi:hypothetical protein